MNETWKEITGTNKKYLVSDSGRIKSLIRKEAGILTPRITVYGYCEVGLRINGYTKSKLVHRLVAQEFLEKQESRALVNHKDGNKRNNNLLNLEYVTHSENIKHAFDKGLIKKPNGIINGNSKLSEMQVMAIKVLIEKGFKNKFIALHFGINPTTVTDIKKGKTWSWLKSE